MLRKKMSLSIVAMTAAVFLFVGATFAWLTITEIVHFGGTDVALEDIDATAVLQVSPDGVSNWTDAAAITIANAVPGNVYYYRIVITNTGATPLNTQAAFVGFTNSVNDVLGDDANFLAGRSLAAVLLYSMTNTANMSTITDQPLSTLAYMAQNIDIAVADSETINFTIKVAETMGNDYQNLRLTIDMISIQSVGE